MVDDKPRMENSEEFLWLEKEIVPKIAEALGKGVGKLRCEIKVPTDIFFVSSIYMVDLIFSYDNKTDDERIRLVVKVQPDDDGKCAFLRTDILFDNEVIFYKYFGKNYDDYPKCVLIVSEQDAKTVIVVENATPFGYKAMRMNEKPGMKRALAAVREIGKFHAKGYVLKEKNPEEFFEVADKLRTIYQYRVQPATIEYFNKVSVRPVSYLRSVNYDSKFCDRISSFFSNAHGIVQECMKPRNELAVLCHGDFTSNNVLFKEEDDGELKTMLIDFAQFCYASPATDISTFIFLSCEDEVRKNFSTIFKAYHDSVIEYLDQQGLHDLEKYSFNAFFEDYKRHAVVGYVIAATFIPVLFLDWHGDFNKVIDNPSKHIENLMASGGDELTKKLADMLLELKDVGGLDHVV